ncbi:uncharacterized protein LOC119303893 [Triticum dicoccoides]|uniref:uncharacterized protein LOC119303893 n=1 Tax=Triticum dicoccoides TaxID=85692 RepID=UPI000E78DFD1|nr:uncharacterized protein LOC119303893 [Triticum dicoccoides]
MEPARSTTSAEGADICLNDLDNPSTQLAIDASSYPNIDLDNLDLDQLLPPSSPELAIDGSSSPNIDWAAALENIPLYIGPCPEPEVATIAPSSPSILPSDAETTMALASQGAMSRSDSDEQLHRDNTCLQVATIASRPLSPYASAAPTFTSDATSNSGAPLRLPSTSTTPSQGAGVKKNEEALALRLDELTITIHSKLCKLECKVQLLSSMMHDLIVKSTLMTRWQKKEQTITYVSSIPRTKFSNPSYKKAIPEILQVLRAACIIHELPLAQTGAACGQQGKRCRRHSDENCRYCISTIDAACHVNDPRVQIFHEACSEHHLLPGQGVAGKAFTTNQPCFLPDMGSSGEQEYPLSHHAKIFRLKGVMAIRLRTTRTGTADFVLEFFLPTDCEAENEQKTVLNSLSGTVQSLCRTLRMVTNKEMQDDAMWEMNKISSLGLLKNKKVKKRKPMARRSPVWKSFTEIIVGDTAKAKCNHCDLELCCDSKNGTSSLRSHLKRCKLNPNNRITGPI